MAYPSAFRARVLDAYSKDPASVEALAKRFGISRATLYNWRTRLQGSESLERSQASPGRPTKLDEQSREELRCLVRERPEASLVELCGQLQERTGVKLSPSTMSRALRRMGLRSGNRSQSS